MACLPLEITNKIASKYPGCWDDLDMIVDGVTILTKENLFLNGWHLRL